MSAKQGPSRGYLWSQQKKLWTRSAISQLHEKFHLMLTISILLHSFPEPAPAKECQNQRLLWQSWHLTSWLTPMAASHDKVVVTAFSVAICHPLEVAPATPCSQEGPGSSQGQELLIHGQKSQVWSAGPAPTPLKGIVHRDLPCMLHTANTWDPWNTLFLNLLWKKSALAPLFKGLSIKNHHSACPPFTLTTEPPW